MLSQTAPDADTRAARVWKPFRGPFQRWPRFSDAVLAVFAFAMTMGIWYSERSAAGDADTGALSSGGFLLFLIGSAALVRRRRNAEVVHGIVLAASALVMLLGHLHGPIFALAISLYSIGRYSDDDRLNYLGVGATLVLLVASRLLIADSGSGDVPELLAAFGVWYVGRRVRARGEYLRLLQERAAQLEREQQAEAEKAVAEERTRIARELHDVVAHQVSLMTVQAGAAKTVADKDPQTAARAMNSVEEAGRKALDELRHLLGVLRPEDAGPELGPQPGYADIPKLIDGLKRTGVDVSLALDGIERELPARLDLAIYRIVQEALTNVLKHAGPQAHVDVSIRNDGRGVTVEVEDDGRGATRLPGSGHGIAGMRERAQLLGGSLEARPLVRGGFRVSAYLPTSEDV